MAHGGQNKSFCILGTTGSGKSTLAREIIAEYPRVVILDSMGEYDDIPGAMVCEGNVQCIEALLDLQNKERFVLDCLTLHEQEGLDILAVAFEIPNVFIVIEEASLYCDPYRLPDEISRIIRYGRKRQIDWLVIARRPSEIHRELTAQAKLLISFRQHEPIDVRYLTSRMGQEAEQAKYLKPYTVVIGGDKSIAPLSVLARLDVKQLTLPLEGEQDTTTPAD